MTEIKMKVTVGGVPVEGTTNISKKDELADALIKLSTQICLHYETGV